jgi:hypothetical protein
MSAPSQDVLDRLEILWRKLEDEGMYVQANTAYLAIEEIKRLRAVPDLLDAAKNMAHASHVIAGTTELNALRSAIAKAENP